MTRPSWALAFEAQQRVEEWQIGRSEEETPLSKNKMGEMMDGTVCSRGFPLHAACDNVR